jgi:DNA modification methylase
MSTRERHKRNPDRHHNKTLYVDKDIDHFVTYVPVGDLKNYRQHARRHSKRNRKLMERSMREFGFITPILVEADGTIISGHLRLYTAKSLGYTSVPVIYITHLSPEQIRAYRVSENRLVELGEWNEELLALEFQGLIELDYDVELTGFEMPEIDLVIENAFAASFESPADQVPELSIANISEPGDLWLLDEHRVLCGDACDQVSYGTLLQGELAQMVISDPPYNVRIGGNVSGLGNRKHGEFVQASGELSDDEFVDFLSAFVRCLAQYSADGSLHYLCIDWRHLHVLEGVCHRYFSRQLNLCVWVKSNGGMGSHYRSRHELVLVFKNGTASHINNVQLGSFGRNRTNVWEYDGCSTGTKDRRTDLNLHPTVKPAEMIADAIKDSSHLGGLILDPFLGSGTAVIACEMTGRTCAGMELDPKYVDVIIRRWESLTGSKARHADTGLTLEEMAVLRSGAQLCLPAPDAVGEV